MGIAHVQDAPGASSASVTSLAVTFGSNTTAGNLLVCVVGSIETGGAAITVSDNLGNTWTRAVRSALQNNFYAEIWYSVITSGGASHKVTATVGSGTAHVSMDASEWSGVAASPLDQTNSAVSSSSNNPSSGNVTTSTAGELYVGVLASGRNAITITAETNWTDRYNHTGATLGPDLDYETYGDGSSLAAGTYAATWSLSAFEVICAAIATFKPSAAGGNIPINNFVSVPPFHPAIFE